LQWGRRITIATLLSDSAEEVFQRILVESSRA
jgi:hypothetical protein